MMASPKGYIRCSRRRETCNTTLGTPIRDWFQMLFKKASKYLVLPQTFAANRCFHIRTARTRVRRGQYRWRGCRVTPVRQLIMV